LRYYWRTMRRRERAAITATRASSSSYLHRQGAIPSCRRRRHYSLLLCPLYYYYNNNSPTIRDYCDTRICAQDVTRSENITNECTLYYSTHIYTYIHMYNAYCILCIIRVYIFYIHTYCGYLRSVPALCYYYNIPNTQDIEVHGSRTCVTGVYERDTTPRNSSLYWFFFCINSRCNIL